MSNEEIAKTTEELNKEVQLMKETFEDKDFKNEFKRVGIKPEQIEELNLTQRLEKLNIKLRKADGEVPPEDQLKLAESFNQDLDKVIQSLSNFTPQSRDKLNKQQEWLIVTSGLLPLLIALATAGILTLTDSILSFFTNVVDVAPPIFVNMIKGRIEGNYKGLAVKTTANYLKAHIHRLALVKELQGDTLKQIEKDVREVMDKANEVGKTAPKGS